MHVVAKGFLLAMLVSGVLPAVPRSDGADHALSLSIVNNSGFPDTAIYLTAPCHKPFPDGVDNDDHWGYIDFTDPQAPTFAETGKATEFELNHTTMSFRLDHFKDASGNYTVNFCVVGGGRLYFSFGDNFDACDGFSSSGPVTDERNPVIYDMMEYYLSPVGTPNLDISRVDFFGVSFSFTTTDAATGKSVSRGHLAATETIIDKFSGFTDNGGIHGNQELFNALVITRPVKDGITKIRVAAPKNLGYAFFDNALANGPRKCAHFYDEYVNQHCWKPNREFTTYDKINYAAKSPVYHCKVNAAGTHLDIFTDAAHTTPYAPMPTMTRPSNSVAEFPDGSQWHAQDSADPDEIDWGFIIMGSVAPGSGCAMNYGSDPVAMYIMAALARGTLHRDDPDLWLTDVLAGDPDTGESTASYPIFQYGKILHQASIEERMYALSYDDVGGLDTDVSIAKANAKATLFFNPIVADLDVQATLTMAVDPEGAGTTSPTVGTDAETHHVGQIVPIVAMPATGWRFTGWTANADAVVTDRTRLGTTAKLVGGDAAITATFTTGADAATLTMAVFPTAGGTTVPTPGNHEIQVGTWNEIAAVPAEGWHFAGWTVSGNAVVKDITAASGTGKASGNTTFTAHFSEKPVDFMAAGSVLKIESDEVPGVDDFLARPKVMALYDDPIRERDDVKAKLAVVDKVPAPSLNAALMRSPLLYSKRRFSDKTALVQDLIEDHPLAGILSTVVRVWSKDAAESPADIGRAIYFSPPVVTAIRGSYDQAGDIFVLHGKHFGSTLPAVSIEYYTEKAGAKTYRRKKCKVLRKDADGQSTLPYRNAKGKANASCMKVLADDHAHVPPEEVGYSEIHVVYPAFKAGVEIPTGTLVLTNRAGLDVFSLDRD
jgi:uncharacterized repeat protein (TIGR02543 family)